LIYYIFPASFKASSRDEFIGTFFYSVFHREKRTLLAVLTDGFRFKAGKIL